MTTVATLAAHLLLLAASDPVIPSETVSSPVAQIIAATTAGIAAAITALGGVISLRRRRRAQEVELTTPDVENTPTRLRERLVAVESRLDAYREHDLPDRVTRAESRIAEQARRITDLEEKMDLHRAADIVIEGDLAPRRRRRPSE